MTAPLAIVTATTNLERARHCIESWIRLAQDPPPIFLILNGVPEPPPSVEITGAQVVWLARQEYLGSVKAFKMSVKAALVGAYPIIACFHDDFEILEPGWDAKVRMYFSRNTSMGLAGFGGAIGLGAEDMYRKPYDPMSLARIGFRSNLVDAEVHGVRSLLVEPVACLDGFSQIGRREFWQGLWSPTKRAVEARKQPPTLPSVAEPPWEQLERLGIVHHLYDSLLGAIAARNGWETWYIPLRSQHHGGRTAVGDPGYQDWAKTQTPGGDHDFWSQAHAIGYEAFRDVLPLRV
jgi:hypothetical protein